MDIIVRFIKKLIFPNTHSSEAFVSYLRSLGAEIGEDTFFWDPINTVVDINRAHMLKLGKNVKITAGVTILAHDYSRSTAFQATGIYAGDAGITRIGDNSFIGMNAILLMGSTIGNNCIVGAGAVVSGIFPDGVVIGGNPANVICTIEEFAKRRKDRELASAVYYAKSWKEAYGSWPTIDEMSNAFAWLYLPRNMDTVEQYASLFSLTAVDKNDLIDKFLNSEPVFSSFDDFINYCEKHADNE